jgi:5-methylthioadenosine/S-adenosylhomocysteine deaminase
MAHATMTSVNGTESSGLLVQNGRFLTMAPGRPDPFDGWMRVGDDGRIAEIGAGDPDPAARARAARVVDAGGAFVAPGFVSAHSHLFTSGTRGLGLDQALYGWIEAMTNWHRHLTTEDLYWMTFHGSIDFLNNGITTAYDFTNGRLEFSAEDAGHGSFQGRLRPPEDGEAQLRAKVDAGIRFVNSVMLDDTVGTHADAVDRFDQIMGYARQFEGSPLLLKMAISGAVQWAPDRSTAELEVEVMHRHGLINQSHFLETPHEIELQRSKFAWYRDAGAFGPDLLFGHFVQATGDQIVEAASHGCGMVWQPTSNGRLASGVADIPRIRAAGMRLGVGLDDQACTDVSDPFQNLRMGIYLLRAVHKDAAAMAVRDMLELHTLESARVLGVEADVGSLEVGKYADFLVVDPRSPDTGPVWDDFGTYVLASSLRNLKQVWVGGELVSQDGVIVHVDAEEVSRQVHDRYARIRQDQLAGT